MSGHLSIYLDESGDLGFDFENKGTPRYFIITLLVCYNQLTTLQFKRAVTRTLRNKIKYKNNVVRELKGTGTTLLIKKYFYGQILKHDSWNLYSIVLDKHKLKNKNVLFPKEHIIYNYLSKEVLKLVNLKEAKTSLLLVIDKSKGKHRINEFNKYLSNHLETMLPANIMYDISHEKSHENCILQAVDMFCWGIRRYYEHNDDAWFSLYKEKSILVEIEDFWEIKKDGP